MTTATRNLPQHLAALWSSEVHASLDYLVGVSNPVPVDERDEQIVEAFGDFRAAEMELKDRVLELLLRLDLSAGPRPYPIAASTYNFMRPVALAQVFLRLAQQDMESLAELRSAYADAEELEERLFRHLLDDYLDQRKKSIARIEGLLGIGTGKAAGPEPEAAPVEEVPVPAAAPAAEPAHEGPAWHDENLSLEERMNLVKGMGVFEKLFAAMAQTDCTACGYDCEGYARAIAEGEEKDLTKCAPGELETQEMLEKIMSGK